MKIQFLNGGLANQAFQYIFARYFDLTNPFGEQMILDDSFFYTTEIHNGYELDKVFGIKANLLSRCIEPEIWSQLIENKKQGSSVPQAFLESGIQLAMVAETDNWREMSPFSGKVYPVPANQYLPELVQLEGDFYYHGYWINKQWFAAIENVIQKELAFPEIDDVQNQMYLKYIKEVDSLSVHIRRGDYVSLGWNWENDVYRKLLTKAKYDRPEAVLFVFSDDIDWCRAHAKELGLDMFVDTVYVEGNVGNGRNYRDMQLMTECRGMIMSNSAFCYLAALLNQKKEYVLNLTKREV